MDSHANVVHIPGNNLYSQSIVHCQLQLVTWFTQHGSQYNLQFHMLSHEQIQIQIHNLIVFMLLGPSAELIGNGALKLDLMDVTFPDANISQRISEVFHSEIPAVKLQEWPDHLEVHELPCSHECRNCGNFFLFA